MIDEETPLSLRIGQPVAEWRAGEMSATHDSNGEWETGRLVEV